MCRNWWGRFCGELHAAHVETLPATSQQFQAKCRNHKIYPKTTKKFRCVARNARDVAGNVSTTKNKKMSTEKFKNKYRIPSARAVWHDYNGGAYFITICTKNKEHYFGEIENAIMHLSEIGEFAQQNLQNIHTHNPYAEIPLFVIMPNHIHIIVFINPDFSNNPPRPRRDVACDVSQGFERSKKLVRAAKSFDALHETSQDVAGRDVAGNVSTNEAMVEIAKHQSLLGFVIGGFKSAVTRFANKNNIEFAWQTRFDDRIIRNQDMMNRVANYTENNVALWQQDRFHKNNEK